MARRGTGRTLDAQYGVVPRVPPDVQHRFGVTGQAQSQLADQAPLTRLIYPPRVEKLLSSQDFRANDWSVQLAAGVGAQAFSDALRLQLPGTMVGWLQEFSIYILGMTDTTSVQFSLRINGGPVPGFDRILNSPGVANLFRVDLSDLRVRVPDGAIIDVAFTNQNASGPWTVGAQFAGWFHPWSDEERIFGHQY